MSACLHGQVCQQQSTVAHEAVYDFVAQHVVKIPTKGV
jgi:hypothetical protein